MAGWLLILTIHAQGVAAIATIQMKSYKSCVEAGEKFISQQFDARYLCIGNE